MTRSEAAKRLVSMARGAAMGLVPGHDEDTKALFIGADVLRQADDDELERLRHFETWVRQRSRSDVLAATAVAEADELWDSRKRHSRP